MKPIFTVVLFCFVLLVVGVLISTGLKNRDSQTTASSKSSISSEDSSTDQTPGFANGSNDSSGVAQNRCIVTIQGRDYDVTDLKGTHSGGDIFLCGTDMTDVFFSMHDLELLNSELRQYLID